ncbi:hypothetical protein HL658_01260 [Azospirillum sp. RWY-5-1]|uniref:Ferritin-like domain-containing protein n=1 Tax=Azospirillum oleiclasticum TaxID=2735135 RepID=A0ABX2T559_9PROT|nr:hypothetical protein [Azospirillum oleiclasticum]NYZ11161.1 hypothetical protein [Azospirillum oleiclasticum]NYZ18323.1 hypothetical protein [Azospirillum oleiclasticum]
MQTATIEPTAIDGPTPLFVEKRFPLRLAPHIDGIRDLYQSGKDNRWQPERDIPWATLKAETYGVAEREAARLTWSRRLWIESIGLKETAALLVRFCMEDGRESDPKFFLPVRGTEEAWHSDCFDRMARAFGGRFARPATRAYEALFNRNLHTRALNATRSLDSYVVTHCAVEDGLELELFRAHRANATNPAVAALLDRCIGDKERHAAFGWLYSEERAPGWSAEERRTIRDEVVEHMRTVELAGFHCAWLSNASSAEAAADAISAAAGLGAATADEEAAVLRAYTGSVREKLATLGIDIPRFDHPLVGSF